MARYLSSSWELGEDGILSPVRPNSMDQESWEAWEKASLEALSIDDQIFWLKANRAIRADWAEIIRREALIQNLLDEGFSPSQVITD